MVPLTKTLKELRVIFRAGPSARLRPRTGTWLSESGSRYLGARSESAKIKLAAAVWSVVRERLTAGRATGNPASGANPKVMSPLLTRSLKEAP